MAFSWMKSIGGFRNRRTTTQFQNSQLTSSALSPLSTMISVADCEMRSVRQRHEEPDTSILPVLQTERRLLSSSPSEDNMEDSKDLLLASHSIRIGELQNVIKGLQIEVISLKSKLQISEVWAVYCKLISNY